MRLPDDATRNAVALAFIFLTSLVSRRMIARNEDATFDVDGHLYFAKTLGEQRRGPFGAITLQVVGASGFSQPFMWHWLVGLFDHRSIRRHQAWINCVIDSIFAMLSYVLILQLGYSEHVALFAVALYVSTPMWFSSLAIGPRIAGFTPRLSSEVATNLFFAATLLPIDLPAPAVLLLGSALATFVLSSSKFGVQALLFLTPLTCLFAQRWIPLVALVLGVVIMFAVSRGGALRQLLAQFSHLAWYFRENLAGRMHVSNRNSLRALFKRSELSNREYVIKLVYRMLSQNSYTSVLVKLPVVLMVIPACATSLLQSAGTNASLLAAPVVAAAIVLFVVNLRPLLFLGEAERYLNYVAFFIVLSAAQYASARGSEWVLWALMLYGLTFWVVESFGLSRLTPALFKDRKLQDAAVLKDLRQLLEPTVVLCYPYHAGSGVYRIMSETPHHVVFCFGTSTEFSAHFNSRYAADYPYVQLDRLEEMADDYGITYLVLDRRALQTRGLEHLRPSARWTPRTVGGATYAVYSRTVDALR